MTTRSQNNHKIFKYLKIRKIGIKKHHKHPD